MQRDVGRFVEHWLSQNVDCAGITTNKDEMVVSLSAELERDSLEAGFGFDEVTRYMGDIPTMIRQRIDLLYDEQA